MVAMIKNRRLLKTVCDAQIKYKHCVVSALVLFNLVSCDSNNKKVAPLFDDIGNYHHAISTNSPLAQRYFDQGLTLFYSFEYGESIRAFRAAIKSDPDCAMCYWGLSLALGSKTDAPLDGNEIVEAKSAINSAMEHVDRNNLAERGYIAALSRRYINTTPSKLELFAGLCSSYSQVSGNNAKDYSLAMRDLIPLLPDDPDAKTLYAASLFDVSQWNFWDREGKPASPYTLEIKKTLESAIAQNKNHPGANHLYVHFMESSAKPLLALPSAKRLNTLVPVSEHMAHMPCHTYYSIGQYHAATLANQQAIVIYNNYVASCKKQGFQPAPQYLYFHNIDYLTSMASMEGRSVLAINSANDLFEQVYPWVQKNKFLQKMLTPKILMLIRFGAWQTTLKIPAPNAQYQYALGIWYYAQGIAEQALNHIELANTDLNQLKKIIQNGPTDANLGKMGYTLLNIAANILEGILDYRSGHQEQMHEKFILAIQLQDSIESADPPPWYFPVRQLYATILLKINRPLDAEAIFKEDLKKHPDNGWSLFGLTKCEYALGNAASAADFENRFKSVWKYADIEHPLYPI